MTACLQRFQWRSNAPTDAATAGRRSPRHIYPPLTRHYLR